MCFPDQRLLGEWNAMIISINPETVSTVAGNINNAYSAVEDAKKVLQSITTHNDWACKERDDINDYILLCKRNVNDAYDSAQRFAGIMQNIASDFSSEEKQIASMFQSVDSIISEVLSITPFNNVITNLPPAGLNTGVGTARSWKMTTGSDQARSWKMTTGSGTTILRALDLDFKPISVVKYTDIIL